VSLHPTRLRYRVLLGRARFEGGDDRLRAAAREDFAFVLARDPDHLEALVNLGQIAYLERALDVAVESWRRALALRPLDADVAERLGKAERELDVERRFAEVAATSFLVRYSPAIPLERAQEVLLICEEARGRLAAAYGTYPPRIVVTLYTPGEFRSATDLHGWVSGLSDGTIRLAVAKRPDAGALKATITHELTHHIVREIAPGAPVWLHEGLAQIEEGRSVPQATERLRSAGAIPDTILSGEILRERDPRKVALFYDAALCFTRFLDDGQRGAIARLLREIGAGKEEAVAFREAFGETREKIFERWLSSLK
jgi:tetratricopeptide (TPR) repeat protein